MVKPSRFEDLLPNSLDPVKAEMRGKIVKLLNTHGEIVPAASSPLGRLWRLVNSDRSSLEQCEEVAQLDAALTSRIFRVANSAAYAANATGISEAIRLIGFKALRELVFSAGVLDQFSSMGVPPGWDVFWLRNIFVARLTERMAGEFFRTDGCDYLAGLLHDIGWLFLATHFPEEFAAVVGSEKPVVEAEKAVLPFSHANIAAALAARSSLPLRAVDGIAYHHKQALTTSSTMIAPNQNPLFLGILLSVCDKVADCSELALFPGSVLSMEEIQQGAEVVWLRSYDRKIDLEAMAVEELAKANEIFTVFFTADAGTDVKSNPGKVEPVGAK